MLTTTFRRAKEAGAYPSFYRKFAKYKGGVKKWGLDTPFTLVEVAKVCGLSYALWALGIAIEQEERDRIARIFACDCAERVLPVFEKQYPENKRPRQAIEIARLYAKGKASQEKLRAVRDAAIRAAWAAGIAFRDTTSDAVWDAAKAAAWAAFGAAGTTSTAPAVAAMDAVKFARLAGVANEKEWQLEHFFELLEDKLREAKPKTL